MRLQQGLPISVEQHLAIVADESTAVITRATALSLLSNSTNVLQTQQIAVYLAHSEDLLRLASATSTRLVRLPERISALKPLLKDPRKAIRVAAARSLVDAGVSVANLMVFKQAFAELEFANELSRWRGEGRLNKGIVEITRGDVKRGEQSLKAAIEVEPYFEQGYINLADIYRSQQRPMQVNGVLNKGLKALPKSAALHYSYGLHLIRAAKRNKATNYFSTSLCSCFR